MGRQIILGLIGGISILAAACASPGSDGGAPETDVESEEISTDAVVRETETAEKQEVKNTGVLKDMETIDEITDEMIAQMDLIGNRCIMYGQNLEDNVFSIKCQEISGVNYFGTIEMLGSGEVTVTTDLSEIENVKIALVKDQSEVVYIEESTHIELEEGTYILAIAGYEGEGKCEIIVEPHSADVNLDIYHED